ncbi:MAG: S41 family peptidase, partial [Pseudomonadota bacterium]
VNVADFPQAPGGMFFYSADPAEQAAVDAGSAGAFYRTGSSFESGGKVPVCRFYGSMTPGPNSHFFSADPGECDFLKSIQQTPTPTTTPQWNFEGNGFNTTALTASKACPSGVTPVYRLYNNAFPGTGGKNPWDSNHRYTRFQSDINDVVNQGWKFEGIAFCAPYSATNTIGFPSSVSLASQCVAPRNNAVYHDRLGSVATEKSWVRSYIDETYLWYKEVPNLAAEAYATPEDYFDVLKTDAKLPSGHDKDRFHFHEKTAVSEAAQQGSSAADYGFELAWISQAAPRHVVVAYTQPDSPAAKAGVTRGMRILQIDGADLLNGNDIDTLNNGLFPSKTGESHTFVFQPVGGGANKTVTLVAADITKSPVPVVRTLTTATGKVGYLLFNEHNYPSEGALIAAIGTLKADGVSDLVIDLRYNGGGLLYVASELAYMVAGPSSDGKIFNRLIFSDKRIAENNDPNNAYPFFNQASGITGTNTTEGVALPSLNLGRVYVLTSGGTASASEAVINGLQGIGVNVIKIGTTTYGKPYGFTPKDNCGTTYYSVEFKGTNHVGFGDFDDGFTPTCQAADDFSHALGDPTEGRLSAALTYRATGACPSGNGVMTLAEKSLPISEPILIRSPMMENAIVVPLPDSMRR